MVISTQKNPLQNWQVNPLQNWQINPIQNWQINPLQNWQINPAQNSLINPAQNNLINPRLNNNVNPNLNYNFNGYFVFSRTLLLEEFVVISNNVVIHFYDLRFNNTRFGVRHVQNGFSLFNLNLEIIGHLENDSMTGFNEFDLNNNWIGIIK